MMKAFAEGYIVLGCVRYLNGVESDDPLVCLTCVEIEQLLDSRD